MSAMTGRIILLAVILFLRASALGSPSSEKARVRLIVRQVESISRGCRGLDDLGRNTLQQSAKLLEMGPPAVYGLSLCLDSPDWRVRFWIADLLGYLGNPDAQRPLLRILADKNERQRVRRQAYKSLRRLKVGIPDELLRGASVGSAQKKKMVDSFRQPSFDPAGNATFAEE